MLKKFLFAGLMMFFVGSLLAAVAFADEIYEEVAHIGGGVGTGPGQFTSPVRGVAADSSLVYVVDKGNNRIQVFDLNGGYKYQWGRTGAGNGEFDGPEGIAILGESVFVVDRNNSRIQKFTKRGEYIGQFGNTDVEKKWGGLGGKCGAGSLGIAASSTTGDVLVCGISLVRRFTSNGRYVDSIGPGVGLGFFQSFGAAINGSGDIYISDFVGNRISKLDSSGRLLLQWGRRGSGKGELNSPAGLAVDSAGNVYVAEYGNQRIQKFGPDGSFKAIIGHIGADTGGIQAPYWVAVDASDNVYVPTAAPFRGVPEMWIKKFRKVG